VAPLLEEEFLKKLERLQFMLKERHGGRVGGSHPSSKAGLSLEFADHKKYFPGDDFRYVDWNIYGRLEKLFIKVFAREEDVPIYILLDTSRSMEVGNKLAYGIKLAAALSYLGLKDLNRVGLFTFAASCTLGIPPRSGMNQVFQIFNYLQQVTAAGETALDASLEEFAKRDWESGLVIIISDMLTNQGFERGLARLQHKRHEVTVIQLLAPEDLDPKIEGEVKLLAAENNEQLRLTVGARVRKLYLENLANYLQQLQEFCLRKNIEYFLISTATPLERAILERLRGVLIK